MNELIQLLKLRKTECEKTFSLQKFWIERDIFAFSPETIAHAHGQLQIINEILSRINSGEIK